MRREELSKAAKNIQQAVIKTKVIGGHLEPERAELLKRQVTNGATTFIQCGAIIPEIEERATSYDPRKLMAPEPKLLSAPGGSSVSEASGRRKRRGCPRDTLAGC